MEAEKTTRSTEALREGFEYLRECLKDKKHIPNFGFKLWNGDDWEYDSQQPKRFTIIINNPGILKHVLLKPNEISLGEAYIYGDIDVEGDLESVFKLGQCLKDKEPNFMQKMKLIKDILLIPSGSKDDDHAAKIKGRVHSIDRDKRAISYHYDTSNDFYRLWLDEQMVYSCAYFKEFEEDIHQAQRNKLDYICRKLRLHRGEKLLDIGCGWGGLVTYAARFFGVQAYGITLSEQQAQFANKRISDLGLSEYCKVDLKDYREISEDESFDKIVSVGMFEHVGREKLGEYFSQAKRLLKPQGAFLNHGIAEDIEFNKNTGPSFTQKYVFPDGELLPISETLKFAEEAGFELRDVESLREHYALTLRNWVKRLETNKEKAIEVTDEVTYRIWKLFMTGSAEGFQTGRLNLYQTLMVKPDQGKHILPLTRRDLYH